MVNNCPEGRHSIRSPWSVLPEMTEADAVMSLCHVEGNKFAYALANGIVGLYGGHERLWRIKVAREGEGGGGM